MTGFASGIWVYQGTVRIFTLRGTIALSALPLAYAIAGPLADSVFEPLRAVGGSLANSTGQLLGTGPSYGISLMFVLLGSANLLLSLRIHRKPQF